MIKSMWQRVVLIQPGDHLGVAWEDASNLVVTRENCDDNIRKWGMANDNGDFARQD